MCYTSETSGSLIGSFIATVEGDGCNVQPRRVFNRKRFRMRTRANLFTAIANGNEERTQKLRRALNRIRDCKRGRFLSPADRDPKTACCLAGAGLPEFSTRIINGTTCEVGDSSLVRIIIRTTTGGQLLCTGSAVTSRAVIFAAHCVLGDTSTTLDDFEVASVSINTGGSTTESITATSIVANTDYDARCGVNGTFCGNGDVAVAFFDQDLGVNTARLLQSDDLQEGETAVVAGYGCQADPTLGDFSTCGVSLEAGFTTIFRSDKETGISLDEGEIRTRSVFSQGRASTCVGDSGGPVLVSRNGEYVIAGLTSYGPSDCGVSAGEDEAGYSNVASDEVRSFLQTVLPEVLE